MNTKPLQAAGTRFFLLLLLSCGTAFAADWPHWLGPNGDNIAPADSFECDLSKFKVLWRTNVGLGYSAVTVANGRAYTLGHDGKSEETVYCFNAATGEGIWSHIYAAQLMPKMHPGGPNATPTVFDGKVITVSKDGQVICLTADKGDKIWEVNLVDAMGIPRPMWGFASSPVIYKDRVVLSAGRVILLELAKGRTIWLSATTNLPGYTTPVVFTYAHNDYIAALDGNGLSIFVAGGDGSEVTRTPFNAAFNLNATTPMISPDGTRLFVSGNTNSELFSFDGKILTPLWSNAAFKNGMNNSVHLDKCVYGIDGKQESPKARFACINWDDGKLAWAQENFGYGTVIGVGNELLLALTENGELVTIKVSPTVYNEVSRRQVLGKRCWTTPVVAGGRIYVRNEKGDVLCLGTR